MILYLNKDSFTNSCERLKESVNSALKDKINIILIHEQDVGSGYCEFNQIIDHIPKELQVLGLLDEIAIPFYRNTEYRDVSLSLLFKRLSDCEQNIEDVSLERANFSLRLSSKILFFRSSST